MPSIFDELTGKPGDQEELSENAEQERELEDLEIDDLDVEDDDQRTPRVIREVVQELFKHGFIEEADYERLYRAALANAELVDQIFEPFDLNVQFDEIRGLVFIRVLHASDVIVEGWTHPLIRHHAFSLEQTLLIAVLRQYLIECEMENGIGATIPQMTVDDVITHLRAYLGEHGADFKDRKRAVRLLLQLRNHHLISMNEHSDRFTIRPLIAHVANPENLTALLQWLLAHDFNTDQFSPMSEEGEDSHE
ncbi:DUF4194 domain-containing protein [Pseudomonas sp. A-B-19]|uniref:DUF4194 domain-containing protein n=1 Tax=Pseudomonas sp. A-B-19 TaxID=2832405 RepID=UPI001CC021CB|nr:DUF4194 domain-containing protein [Pseudomonas sp. A-B-19]